MSSTATTVQVFPRWMAMPMKNTNTAVMSNATGAGKDVFSLFDRSGYVPGHKPGGQADLHAQVVLVPQEGRGGVKPGVSHGSPRCSPLARRKMPPGRSRHRPGRPG